MVTIITAMAKQKDSPISTEQKTLLKEWDNHRGSIVMVVGDEVFSTKRASKVDKMIEEIEKKYHRRPLITYTPKYLVA